jgi:hypothetical protein
LETVTSWRIWRKSETSWIWKDVRT